MTLALDTGSVTKKAGAATTSPYTLTMPMTVVPGSDRLLMVAIVNEPFPSGSGTTVTSITYAGVAMTIVDGTNATVVNGTLRTSLYYLLNPVAGTGDVVVTMAQSSALSLVAAAWTGAAQTSTFGTAVKATGTSTAPSVTVSSAVGEFVMDSATVKSVNPPPTVGPGQTLLGSTGIGVANVASSYEPGAASVAMSWTTTSMAWGAVAVPIKPSTAVSSPLGGGAGTTVDVTSGELRVVPLRAAPWGFSQQQDPSTRNMIPNGEFLTADGWTPNLGVLSVTADDGPDAASNSLTLNTVGSRMDTAQFPITSGTSYTAKAWVRPPNGKTMSIAFRSGAAQGDQQFEIATSASGDGTTWYPLSLTVTLTNWLSGGVTLVPLTTIALRALVSSSGVAFSIALAEMYAIPAMLENNAAALEASGMYQKVLMGTIDGSEIVYDDVWTLPSVAPSGVIAFTGMPTANSPSGSLVATTQDLIVTYPFPYGVSTNIVPYPRFARSRSDASYTTDLVPSIYLSTWDAGDVPHMLVGVHIIAEQMTPDLDRVGISWRWGDIAPWSVPQFASNADAWFEILGENFGTKLSVCVTIYDAVTTDPIGPGILSVIPWVEELEVDGASLPEQARSSPEGA